MKHRTIRRLTVAGCSIAVVEETVVRSGATADRRWLTAKKAPIAIIVSHDGEDVAFDMDGNALDPLQLRHQDV